MYFDRNISLRFRCKLICDFLEFVTLQFIILLGNHLRGLIEIKKNINYGSLTCLVILEFCNKKISL